MPNDSDSTGVELGKGEGIYLFCFARPPMPPVLNADGLDDRYSVSHQVFKDIMAVLSKVSIEEFCGPSADSRMKDISWVGPRACRHEEVIEKAMRQSPVLPARFGTIFSSLEGLEKLVEMHHDTIRQFLDEVADKEEWSVKGLIDKAKAKEELCLVMLSAEAERLASLSPGKRYFEEQRIRNNVEKEVNNWLKEVCKGIGKEFGRFASDFCERKVLSREATGLDADMILNWAFLIPRDLVQDFRSRADEVNEDNKQKGLTLEVSGPWPPYSFCPALEMEPVL